MNSSGVNCLGCFGGQESSSVVNRVCVVIWLTLSDNTATAFAPIEVSNHLVSNIFKVIIVLFQMLQDIGISFQLAIAMSHWLGYYTTAKISQVHIICDQIREKVPVHISDTLANKML